MHFDTFVINFELNGRLYSGNISPKDTLHFSRDLPSFFNVTLNNIALGVLQCTRNGWQWEDINTLEMKSLAEKIGGFIVSYYM